MDLIAAQPTTSPSTSTTTTVASTSTAPSPPSAMDAGDVFAGLSALIAVAALIVAIIALRRQTALGKEQNAIAREQTAIEEGRRTDELDDRRRGHIVAKFIGDRHFVLANQGAALAREIRCSFEALDGRMLPAIFGLEDQPFDIQPGQSLEFDVAVAMADSRVMRATVSWLDDAGPHAVFQDLRL